MKIKFKITIKYRFVMFECEFLHAWISSKVSSRWPCDIQDMFDITTVICFRIIDWCGNKNIWINKI